MSQEAKDSGDHAGLLECWCRGAFAPHSARVLSLSLSQSRRRLRYRRRPTPGSDVFVSPFSCNEHSPVTRYGHPFSYLPAVRNRAAKA